MTGDPEIPADGRRHGRTAALAGHSGDEGRVRELLGDSSGRVREVALSALDRLGALSPAEARTALGDPSAAVRRRACEAASRLTEVDLRPMLADPDHSVVENAAWALGERGPEGDDALEALVGVATGHPDSLCQEAAVAALGALGDDRALPTILAAAAGGKATIRRRAVIALAPFSGAEVEAALKRALDDRDWQVRQAAEDLIAPTGGPPGT